MPHGPYLTPDEEKLMRMLRQSGGSPQGAAESLLERLEALEAAVADLEQRGAEEPADEPDVAQDTGATAPPAPE
jgi:hypothetical protein